MRVTKNLWFILFTALFGISAMASEYRIEFGSISQAQTLKDTLDGFTATGEKACEVVIDKNGEWLLLSEFNTYNSHGFNAMAIRAISEYRSTGKTIDQVAVSDDGDWIVVSRNDFQYGGSLGDEANLISLLRSLNKKGIQITELTLAPGDAGYVLIANDEVYASRGIDSNLQAAMNDIGPTSRKPGAVSYSPDGGWIFTAGLWSVVDRPTTRLKEDLRELQLLEIDLNKVTLGPGGGHLIIGDKIEPYLHPMARAMIDDVDVYDWLDTVPGVQVAIIEDNVMTWSAGYGEREAGTNKPVLTDTLHDAASLSKYITAFTVMTVARDYFDFSKHTTLNSMIDDPGTQLEAWHDYTMNNFDELDLNSFWLPSGIKVKNLLSNTSAMVTGPNFPNNYITTNTMPGAATTTDWLLGYNDDDQDGNWEYGGGHAIWVDPALAPVGDNWTYTTAGFMLAMAMAEQRTGKDFPSLANEKTFSALGMDRTSFAHPLPWWLELNASAHHNGMTPVTRAHFPFIASGGLHTTAAEYAKALIPLLDGGKNHNGINIMGNLVYDMMSNETPDRLYGLGLGLSRQNVNEVGGTFSHNGSHPGRSYSLMLGTPKDDVALVVFVNSNSQDARDLADAIKDAFNATIAP